MPKKWGYKYETPEELEEVLEAYFTGADTHTEMQPVGRPPTLMRVPAPQPYTVAAMQVATGLSNSSWANYKSRPGFDEVIAAAYKRMEAQWLALTARGCNNGGVIFYLGNVFKGEYQSQVSLNVGGQPGNPMTVVQRTDKERLANCTDEQLDQIERILREAEGKMA